MSLALHKLCNFMRSHLSILDLKSVKSKSCFSGVLGFVGLAVVGELGSDEAK